MQNLRQKLATAGAVLGSFVLAIPAHATFTVPTEVTDAGDAVLAVGAAVFGIMVSIKLYKWIKRAL